MLLLSACFPGEPESERVPAEPSISEDYRSHASMIPELDVIERTCATDEVLAAHIAADPRIGERMRAIEEHTARQQETASATNGTVIIIPTIVHVVYRTDAENITDAQILSQMDVLNADFRRTNADADMVWPQATDTEIEFVLSGITRTQTTVNGFGYNDAIKFAASGGHDVYMPSQYLNMWVGKIGGGILGYAQFPGDTPATDGVVIDPLYFGTIGTATAPFDLGRTTTHEVGHWLNLRHIWGDGACGVDDFVADTPTAMEANYGCLIGNNSCMTTDMVQNYMDYSDDSCMNLFTVGQMGRMRALFNAGGDRVGLVTAPGDVVGELCFDGVDNDGDVATDCADSDCSDNPSCIELQCGDGMDNDGDGDTDCADPDCTDAPECAPCGTSNDVHFSLIFDDFGSEISWQLVDGSGGLVTGGSGYNNNSPDIDQAMVLANGDYTLTIFDSVGDGLCCGYGDGSYALTTGAGETLASGGEFSTSESTPFCIAAPTPEVCDDGADNDFDGDTDCEDADCMGHPACPTPVEVCDDNTDNDLDGDMDCADTDCAGDPACGPVPDEVCFDDVDNDFDGDMDCADSDCEQFLYCWFANNTP